MKLVSKAHRRAALIADGIVTRGQRHTYRLIPKHNFHAYNLRVVFPEEQFKHLSEAHPPWDEWDEKVKLFNGLAVDYVSRFGPTSVLTVNDYVRRLSSFICWPLGGGVDWGWPRPWLANQAFEITVINNSAIECIQLRWVVFGDELSNIVAPPPVERVVPQDHQARIALLHEEIKSDQVGLFDWYKRNKVEDVLDHALEAHWDDRWHETPLSEPTNRLGELAVVGDWWRVPRKGWQGGWAVCRFDREPVPDNAHKYYWRRYEPQPEAKAETI